MLKFSYTYINLFFKKILKKNRESDGIFETISFVETEILKTNLFDYLTNMCLSGQGTMVVS